MIKTDRKAPPLPANGPQPKTETAKPVLEKPTLDTPDNISSLKNKRLPTKLEELKSEELDDVGILEVYKPVEDQTVTFDEFDLEEAQLVRDMGLDSFATESKRSIGELLELLDGYRKSEANVKVDLFERLLISKLGDNSMPTTDNFPLLIKLVDDCKFVQFVDLVILGARVDVFDADGNTILHHLIRKLLSVTYVQYLAAGQAVDQKLEMLFNLHPIQLLLLKENARSELCFDIIRTNLNRIVPIFIWKVVLVGLKNGYPALSRQLNTDGVQETFLESIAKYPNLPNAFVLFLDRLYQVGGATPSISDWQEDWRLVYNVVLGSENLDGKRIMCWKLSITPGMASLSRCLGKAYNQTALASRKLAFKSNPEKFVEITILNGPKYGTLPVSENWWTGSMPSQSKWTDFSNSTCRVFQKQLAMMTGLIPK